MNVRALFSKLHLWLGLAAGAVLVVVGVTGSVLVFRPQIERALHPELTRVAVAGERAPLDAIVGAVRRRFPRLRPTTLGAPRAPDEPWRVYTRRPSGTEGPEVYVDPYTAEVLGALRPDEAPMELLFRLHAELLAGKVGAWVVGASGIVLLLLCASGVVLWWPSRRGFVGLKVKWRAGTRRTNLDLHRSSGIWLLAPLVLVAATGVGLIFYFTAGHALNWVTGSPPRPAPPASAAPPDGSPTALAAALRTAGRALPRGQVTFIDIPATPEAPISVRMRLPGELHPNGRSFVYVDQWSGAVLRVDNALEAPLGSRILFTLWPLHIGRFGLWSKVLYVLVGLLPLVLAVSGTLIWWNRRPRNLRAASARSPDPIGAD